MKKKFFPWIAGVLVLAGVVIASFPAPALTQFDPSEKLLKVTFDAPFTLHFSQIMNQGSVEEAFQLSPAIEGEFRWKDWRTLEFYPAEPLTIGDEYQLTIKQNARSIWLKKMGFDTALNYVVTGPPYVLFADPANEAVITNGAITVMFDRPMDLKGLKQDELIQTEPKMEGDIRLMGMSAFQLIPKRLSAAKKYSIVIPAGLNALDGGKTKEVFSWTVAAPSLKVIKTTPSEGDSEVKPTDPMTVYFNEEVDLNGIKPGINAQLFPSNDLDAERQKKMDGFFNTEVTYGADAAGEPKKDILVFAPSFPYQPGEEYRFTLRSDADLALERDFELRFKTADGTQKSELSEPAPDSSFVPESDSLFEGDGQMKFFVRGENPKLKLRQALSAPAELSVCQIPSNEYIRVSAADGWNSYKCADTEPIPINPVEKNDGLTLDLAKHSDLKWITGVYFVSLKKGETKSVQLFMIEDSKLFMKRSASDLFVWALDIKSGDPISGMEMEILNFDGEEAARGVTDASGVFRAEQPFAEGISVRGKKEDEKLSRWGLVSDQWATNETMIGNSELIVLLNQDTFFPGDTLHVKGIWRPIMNDVLALPDASHVTVAVEGSQENFLEPKRVPLRRNGSFDDSFVLPADSPPGIYQVTVSDVNSQRLTDPVPIQIQTAAAGLQLEWLESRDDYSSGSAPVTIIKARYQNGIPAGGAKGIYELFRKPSSMNFEEGAIMYSFDRAEALCKADCGQEEAVARKEFVFDENGVARLILTDEKDDFLKAGYDYSLRVSASLPSSDSVAISRHFEVHQGAYELGLGVKHAIVQESEAIEARVVCLDFDQKPVVGRQVRLSLIGNQGRGKTVFESIITSQPASYAFSVPGSPEITDGVYVLRAESQDEENNKIAAEQLVFVNRDKGQAFEKDLFLAMDQGKYFVGGRATLLINEPNASKDRPVPVIVTYERDGLLDYEAMNLTAPVTEINVPIKEAMAPRFLTTVTRFNRGIPPTFSSVSREIEVGNDASQIFVDLSYEPLPPSPGEEVTLKFLTRDYQNQPMPSVLTVNVLDGTPRADGFSFHSFFAKKSASLNGIFHPDSVRSVYFNPVLPTDSAGRAELTFTLPQNKRDLTLEIFATKNASFFGHHTAVLKLNQRLLIQPILPSYAVPGDQTFFGAAIKNLSDQPVHSRVDLVSADIAKGDYSRNISLQPGQQTEISFSVLVDPLLEKDELTLKFKSEGDYADASLPLRHLKSSVPVTDGSLIETVWTGRVQPLKDAHPGPGSLVLSMSGSPLVDAKVRSEVLDLCPLENPYVLAARLLSNLAFLPDSPADNDLVTARALLADLQSSVQSDGTYRFWNEELASPTLSALVLWAYSEAARQGLTVDANSLAKTVEFLWQAVDQSDLSPEDRFFILWALSQNGQYDTERTLTFYKEAPDLSLEGKAFLLLNLDQLVKAGQGSLASLMDSLKAELNVKATRDRKTTALLLYSLSEVDSQNPLLKTLADSLFLEKGDLLREADIEESLWTILGLELFAQNTTSDPANFIARIKLNGSLILDQSVTDQKDVFETRLPAKTLYTNDLNDLFVKKEGESPLYLDAHLISYLDPTLISRTEENMLISRHTYEITEDGGKSLVTVARKGKRYLSELEFIVPQDARYVTLLDEVPAGFRAYPGLSEYFGASSSADGRVIYFAPFLPAGVYKISTELWAVWPGTYLFLPAVIHPLFESAVVGRTEGGTIQVME